MTRLVRLLLLIALSGVSYAQTGLTTITASHLNVSGAPIAAGTVLFTPVNTAGQPIAFVTGDGGGLNAPKAFSCTITAGALSGCQVPDSALTTPVNLLYTIDITATAGFTFRLPNVPNITGTNWALDNYAPSATTTNSQTVQVTYGASAPPSPCATPSFYYQTSVGLSVCVAGTPVPVTGATSINATAMAAAVASQTGCTVAGNAWNPATNTCTTSSIASPYTGVNLFGDSITFGFGTTDCTGGTSCNGNPVNGWAYGLLALYGGNGANYAFPGDQAGDLAMKVWQDIKPSVSNNLATAFLISTNDATIWGTNTALQEVFSSALDDAIVWAAIPDAGKVNATGCTLSSGWTATDHVEGGANGSTITCSIVTYGGPIYLSNRITSPTFWSPASQATVTIDGVNAGTFSSSYTGVTVTLQNGSNVVPQLHRYTGIAAGTHTVVITYTGPTGGSPIGYLWVGWLATPYPAGAATAPPVVYVGGTPRNQADDNEPATGQYNTLIQSDITQLAGDGLNAKFVDVRSTLDPLTGYNAVTIGNKAWPVSTDNPYHPSNLGHAQILQAFASAMEPNSTGSATQTGRLLFGNAAPSGTCTMAQPLFVNTAGSTGSIFYVCQPGTGPEKNISGSWHNLY